jgi:hypothetical protein
MDEPQGCSGEKADRPARVEGDVFRLRVLRQTGILTPAHDPVINECAELVKIVVALIRNSRPT